MWSDYIVYFLIIVYIAIMIVSLCEHRWTFALYWFGASILNVAVVAGMK